jgi:hypothetical protein
MQKPWQGQAKGGNQAMYRHTGFLSFLKIDKSILGHSLITRSAQSLTHGMSLAKRIGG